MTENFETIENTEVREAVSFLPPQSPPQEFLTAAFPVDADLTRAEVIDKKRKIKLVHSLKTPSVNQVAEYERNTAARSEIGDDDEITLKLVSDRAAAALYDSLCEKLVIHRTDDANYEAVLSPQQIRKLTPEQKGDAISQFLNNLHVDVSSTDEADEFDFLFETESDLKADVRLGRFRDEPDFHFAFYFRRPDALVRENLREVLSKTKFKRNDTVTNTQTVQNVSVAVRFFDKHFERGENLLVQGENYSETRRIDFLKAFNPRWKAQIVQAILNFF